MYFDAKVIVTLKIQGKKNHSNLFLILNSIYIELLRYISFLFPFWKDWYGLILKMLILW